MGDDAVASMLTKLSDFSHDALTGDEREALAALLAPGIEWALDAGADEVEAFGYVLWSPQLLAQSLRRALDRRDQAAAPDGDDGDPAAH
jgi:hypothetical protein